MIISKQTRKKYDWNASKMIRIYWQSLIQIDADVANKNAHNLKYNRNFSLIARHHLLHNSHVIEYKLHVSGQQIADCAFRALAN